jgi:hypothetical protein
MPEKPVKRRLKLISCSAPFQTTTSSFGSCWRDSASLAASHHTFLEGRGAVRAEEARTWLEDRRNEAIAEATLLVSTLAMIRRDSCCDASLATTRFRSAIVLAAH